MVGVGCRMAWLQALTPVDYAVIGILVAALAIGWAQGLVELLTGFLVFVVTTFVAGRYSGTVMHWLNRMWDVQSRLADILERRINLPSEAHKVPLSAIPWEKALDWIQAVPIPEPYKVTLAKRLSEWSAGAGSQTAAEYIINQLAASVLGAVVFIVMVAALGWGLALVARLVSDQIKEIPLVGTANRLLGSAVAMLEALVVLSLVVGLLAPMLSMYGMESMGNLFVHAQLSPPLLSFYQWLRQVVFGIAGGSFFAS